MAANQVGQVEIRIVPDGSQFGPQLQAILDAAAGKASAAGQRIGQSIGGGVAPQVQMVGRSVADMNMQFDNAARKALAFTGAVMGTKAVIEGMVGKLAGVFDQLAQAQAGFGAILGERRGEALLDEIRQFAKDTPFATKQLVNYSQQLLGVGMASEKIVPLLRDTGNVIASVGGDTANISRVLYAMSQIQTVGRLMGQDAMQLQSALIPITKLLASYLGKTTQEVKKLQEQGRISAEEVFAAIQAAGQKVPQAMENAVKTIAGAREVLRDSIQILLQDAPALRMVYDDIVKGIQTLAAALSSDEVSGAIARAFNAVGDAYEAIKPTISAFIDSMGEGSMSTLEMFTQLLSTFASVLDSIPQPVLDMVAKTLAMIAILKAPMMLIKYVEQFKRMADIFKGDTLTIQLKKAIEKIASSDEPTRRLAAENQRLAQSYDNLGQAASGAASKVDAATGKISGSRPGGALAHSRIAGGVSETELIAMFGGKSLREQIGTFREYSSQFSGMNKLQAAGQIARNPVARLGSSVGLMYAGQMVGQGENAGIASQTVSGALTGASYGMMFGGPWGAAAGLAVGGMMSFFSAQKKAAEEHRKAMEEEGRKTAQAYIDELDKTFGSEVSSRKIVGMEQRAEDMRLRLNELLAVEMERLKADYIELVNPDTLSNIQLGQVEQLQLGRTIDPRVFAMTPTMAEAQTASGYSTAAAASLGFDIPTMASLGGDEAIKLKADLALIEEQTAAEKAAILENLSGAIEMLSPEAAAAIKGSLTQTSKFGQWATVNDIAVIEQELRKYGLTLQDIVELTREETARIIESFEGISDAEKQAAEDATAIVSGYEIAMREAESMWGSRAKLAGLELKVQSDLKSATDAATKAYQNQKSETAQLTAEQAKFNAAMSVYALTREKVAQELKNKGVIATEADKIAKEEATKAYEQMLKELEVQSISSIGEMSKAYGFSASELGRILDIQGKIDPNMKITVTVAIDEALRKLMTLLDAAKATYAALEDLGVNDSIGDRNMLRARGESLDVRAIQAQDYLRNLYERQTPEKAGGRGGQSFSDKVKSAAQALENSIKSAMESVKGAAEAWKATIKDRVQYEAAVSTGRALRNVQRQATDIRTLTSGISQLKARGLTEEALTALDINAITDVRQVKRLLSASPEELKRLSTAVAQRDKLASTLASERQREENRKTITQAILEAARILGYKFTEAQAKAISAQFNITTDTDAKRMIEDILRALSGGRITSVPT